MADGNTKQHKPHPNGAVPNPTGKGGFGDHPEHRSDGRWSPETSFTYWYNKFKSMTLDELDQWKKDNPRGKRMVSASLALSRIDKADNDLKEFQEIADRSEGRPKQSVDLTSDGKALPAPIMGGSSVHPDDSLQQDSGA